ncbi:WxL domain-containing protein [Vagococcus carniphilus]|uniref:WxL domain-containing protein n=1 Tax=Vagococcus carniphilus TaxID=218144 RepID=UPI002890DD3E|nr:WxL domain-containing protein [Vagococcus carniphilus]MDT2848873.1 WxL domain-containing protein [Vagococcus carniphilus]
MKINVIKVLSLTTIMSPFLFTQSVNAENSAKELSGNANITYEISDFETPPVDPEHPEIKVDPGNEYTKTNGLLRFDFIPRLHFGAQEISSKDKNYQVNAQLFKDETAARPNYIQITDNRGSMAGWEVSVRQETPFENKEAKNKILKGSVLSFDKQWVNSVAPKEMQPTVMKDAIKIEEIVATYPIAKAEKGKGLGTWVIPFGSTGEVKGQEKTLTPLLNADGKPVTDASFNNKPIYKNSGIQLFVPGAIQKDPVKYKTVLTWTLSELS